MTFDPTRACAALHENTPHHEVDGDSQEDERRRRDKIHSLPHGEGFIGEEKLKCGALHRLETLRDDDEDEADPREVHLRSGVDVSSISLHFPSLTRFTRHSCDPPSLA